MTLCPSCAAVGPGSDMWMDAAQDPRFAAGAELEGERATLLDYLRALQFRARSEPRVLRCVHPHVRAGPGGIPPFRDDIQLATFR